MMTRLKSPKSKQRSNNLATFYAGNSSTTEKKRKRSTEHETSAPIKAQKPTSTGIPSEQLSAMFEQYTTFLTKKKSEGKGFLTLMDHRQETRLNQITMLGNTFANLHQQQTFENWQALLILLVQYRITAYTENFIQKSESTYGDALWAVQEHALDALAQTLATNPDCPTLTKLMQYKNNSSLCSKETEEETKILTAAFGHYTALRSDHPQLTTVTSRVKQFITEISQPNAEASVQFSSVYGGSSSPRYNGKDKQELNPSAKVARLEK